MSDPPSHFPTPPTAPAAPAIPAPPEKSPTESGPPPAGKGTPSGKARHAEKAAPSRVLVGVISGFVGVAAGYLVGSARARDGAVPTPPAMESTRLAPAPAPKATTSGAKVRRRPAAEPDGAAHVAVDMGKPDSRIALAGPWSDVQLGSRTAGRLGFTASLTTTLTPTGDPYGLAIVARVDEGALDVGVRVNEQDVGRLRVSTGWDMHAMVLQPDALRAGANTLEFVLPPGPNNKAVAMLIDSLHLAPLQMRAHADLSGANPHGALIDGYYGREGEGEQAQSWSAGKQTRAGLMLKPLNADYEVELRAAAFGPLQPLGVEARVNGTSVGSVNIDKEESYSFRVPAGLLSVGYNTVTFAYAKTIKPSESDPTSRDQRELGIRISRVTVKPTATQ
jgi:hypothetical protein